LPKRHLPRAYPEVASRQEAKRILRTGEFYGSTDEALAKIRRASNRGAGQHDLVAHAA
jgi:hypothetical protein